jgi:hypothetical protein
MDFRFSCATCAVVVSPASAAMLIAWRVDEEGMKGEREGRKKKSRLR